MRLFQVVLGNYDNSKKPAQRRINWQWNNEVANSGIGRTNDPNEVHLQAKWRFALPLLQAGTDEYSLWIQDLYDMIVTKYPNDGEKIKQLMMHGIHTEQMIVPMVSRFLEKFQYYWTNKGVNLTDPEAKKEAA